MQELKLRCITTNPRDLDLDGDVLRIEVEACWNKSEPQIRLDFNIWVSWEDWRSLHMTRKFFHRVEELMTSQ